MTNSAKVRVESTPNPATLKFCFDRAHAPGSFEYLKAQDTESSPLAAKLFGFPWTQSVFLGTDFVSVTKQDWVEWEVLAEPLAGLINEHLEAGEPVYVDRGPDLTLAEDPSDAPIVREIKQALNREIRPVVALDGGDVEFVRFEESVLFLRMKGACAGCPSSSATLKQGIEVRLRELFPEISEIRAV